MEYLREAINSTKGRKGKSKPPLGGVYKDVEVEEAKTILFTLRTLCTQKLQALFSTCYVSMTGTRLPDERAQAVRSLCSLLNYVRLDPRKGYVGSLS